VENLRFRVGMKGCFQAKGEGKGGGIVLYWLEEVKLIFCLLVIATLMFMSVGALMITCDAVLLCMEKQKLLIDTRCGLQSVLLNLALTNRG
jgi:hypothetical protein